MNDLTTIIMKLNEDFDKAVSQGTAEAQERLLALFDELGDLIREKIQEKTKDDMQAVIDKLKNGLTITPTDREQIKLWLVGDAEQYAKSAGSMEVWKTELNRIMGEIKGLRDADDEVEEYSKFRALLREASRVLADIFYFQQQKERVDKFEEAVSNMGPAERPVLIRILEQKMNSPEF